MPRLSRSVGRSGHSAYHPDRKQSTDFVSNIGDLIEPQSDGCWIFKGPTDVGGYGIAFDAAKSQPAHRFVYSTLVDGGIPKGMHLHHECHVPACVNPKHLTPMSPSDHASHHQDLRRAAVAA